MDDNKRLPVSSAWDIEEIEKMPETDSTGSPDLESRAKIEKVEDDPDTAAKLARNITRPPKKWSYQDEDEDLVPEAEPSSIHGLGDLLWCRQSNVCYYPALIVNDPHFKFHTKIVKSESGSSTSSNTAKGRQYHVQFLGDNRLSWVQDKLCMPYCGVMNYEQLAINDVANMKIYKPKPEKMISWKEALVIADEVQKLDKLDRIRRVENQRVKDGLSFIDKLDTDKRVTQDPVPVSPFKPIQRSPKKTKENEKEDKDQRKSQQYRRKDEMQYKMNRHAGRSLDGSKTKKEEAKTPPSVLPPMFNANASFSKSFKMKKEKKEEVTEALEEGSENPTVIRDDSEADERMGSDKEDESPASPAKRKEESDKRDVPDYVMCNQKLEQDVQSEGFGEGALVWAKMRGYPYWPSVITRDPLDGAYVKVAETIYKNSRRLHVLFLEYGNQRAWIGSGSVKKFKGIELFNKEKEKASKKTRPDFTPNKRIKPSFDKAVNYAEELRSLPDEERLERVFLKYGWGLVEENSSLGQSHKGMISEHHSEEDMTYHNSERNHSAEETRRSSESRRGSGEAESRIDPGTDEPEPNTESQIPRPNFNPLKRERKSLTATDKSGETSDSESEIGDRPPVRKKTKANNKSLKKKTPAKKEPEKSMKTGTPAKTSTSKSSQAKMSPSTVTTSEALEKDEFPRVGDLVWGRMPGFPYWPAFITRSPQNIFRKMNANGKCQYHVQFFGWNDESGWVTSVIEFEGLEAFQSIAVKKKSDKSYSPGRGANLKKWEKAAREAEDTMGLTRQERVDQYLVSYAHKLEPADITTTPKRKSEDPKQGIKSAHKTTPKSSSSPSKAALPRGWIAENRSKEGKETVVYISPDGVEFPSKAAMNRYVATEKKSSGVIYVADESLPIGWRCQKVESTTFFFSPIGERFDSRRKVAERMKSDNYSEEAIRKVLAVDKSRRPAPKSVLKRRGEYLTDESSQESDDESDDMVKILPKGYKYRFGGPYDKYLDIERLFDPSNGGLIDMVQLPDIFLEHPTVRVQESDNEMIISDVDSGEFIAKKIIYD